MKNCSDVVVLMQAIIAVLFRLINTLFKSFTDQVCEREINLQRSESGKLLDSQRRDSRSKYLPPCSYFFKKKSRTHNCFCSDWLKLLDCFVTCATFSGDPMHRRKLHAKLNWNYHVTPLFIHSMHLSFCSIPTFRSECLKYLGRWKKLKDNELFDNLRTDLLFQFWHFLVFEDGYAFSQEEHGAVRQGDMVRAYDTTLPSRAMDKL